MTDGLRSCVTTRAGAESRVGRAVGKVVIHGKSRQNGYKCDLSSRLPVLGKLNRAHPLYEQESRKPEGSPTWCESPNDPSASTRSG